LRALAQSAVDLAGVVACDAPTGVALIHVDDRGENCITVVAGANASARAAQVPDAMLSKQAILLMQLEVPLDEAASLARRARQRGARVVLNAAPATRLPRTLLDDVDVLVVNETEALALCEKATTDVLDAAHRLASGSSGSVVVTRGALGALYVHRGEVGQQRAASIDVVDTVGAGDAFAGALVAALDRGEEFATAIREGVAAGSLACLTSGAQDSLPARDAIAQMAATLAL
jgi:ribokinase